MPAPDVFIVENHHYHAWCREHMWEGPLRFKRHLAEEDAAAHEADAHPEGQAGPDQPGQE